MYQLEPAGMRTGSETSQVSCEESISFGMDFSVFSSSVTVSGHLFILRAFLRWVKGSLCETAHRCDLLSSVISSIKLFFLCLIPYQHCLRTAGSHSYIRALENFNGKYF